MKRKLVALLAVITLFSATSHAQLKLASIFADGMILQQQTSAPIWGKATPKQNVTIKTSWDNKAYTAVVGADSIWLVKVATPKASYTSYNITVEGKNKIIINNVLIGEVWLCGGQSNMEMPMNGFAGQPTEGAMEDILYSSNSNLRCYNMRRTSTITPQFDCKGEWVEASPATTGKMTAAGYYFARMVQRLIDIPVAIINCNWGGSSIEAWIPSEGFASFADKKLPKTKEDNIKQNQTPTVLYNGMLNAIAGYSMKGAIWYQGETNRSKYYEYGELFSSMHTQWEKRWKIGEFPIYFCQLAPYGSATDCLGGYMREAQLKIAQTQKNTGIAILTDVGEQYCIHPAKKRQVGERLALIALAKDYGFKETNYLSPEFDKAEFGNGAAVVKFKNAPYGVGPINVNIEGFELAGDDKVFYPATGKIVSGKLTVKSDKVASPVAVRYAFKDYVVATLFGGGNYLPVSSFRSDDWPYAKQ